MQATVSFYYLLDDGQIKLGAEYLCSDAATIPVNADAVIFNYKSLGVDILYYTITTRSSREIVYVSDLRPSYKIVVPEWGWNTAKHYVVGDGSHQACIDGLAQVQEINRNRTLIICRITE